MVLPNIPREKWMRIFAGLAVAYVVAGCLIYGSCWLMWKYVIEMDGLIPFIGFQFIAIFAAVFGPAGLFVLVDTISKRNDQTTA